MPLFHREPKRMDLEEGVRAAELTSGAVLLDVRTRQEYGEGHVPGSVNLPLDELEGLSYEKDTPLFVYCRSGARSGRAVEALKKRGYEKAVNIGGVMGYKGKLERGTGGESRG